MSNYIGLDAHSKICVFVVLDAMGRQVACSAFIRTHFHIEDGMFSLALNQ